MLLVLLLLLITNVHLGESKCDVCVTQPLLTSNVECPVCNTFNGIYDSDNELRVHQWLGKIGTQNYSDANNPNDWTTCDVEAPPCNASYKYRSYDGSCNNLEHPTWGMTGTAYSRILPANYRDRKHLIRIAVDGNHLPLVRNLSTTVFTDRNKPDTVTLMAMQWGQVVAHDITLTLFVEKANCCDTTTYNEERCLAVMYPSDDYFYSQHNVTCDNMVRNKYTRVGSNCAGGPAQQVNEDSHPIDGSLIYGSDTNTANSLRTFVNGRLKTRILQDGREFLSNVPQEEAKRMCKLVNITEPCYTAGDVRVTQNTQLSVLVNMLFRAHNNIADKLQHIHPDWNDETLYQETRSILVAILQHIHYNEWLEFYLGTSTMTKFKLYPKKHGHTVYNSKINLMSINDFASGAFRVAHSGIQGFLNMYNKHHHFVDDIPISTWMDRPLIVEQGCNYDKFLRGLAIQPMQLFDRFITTQMTNLLNRGFKPYGKDLTSIDILRGRDNGLAPYVHYLEVCTGFKPKDFDDLKQFIPGESVNLLEQSYNSITDIDMLVGGSLESYVNGSRLGPTFLCIITEAFYRKKWGDRFWYEVGGQPHSFTQEQLQEIRKMTVSKLICDYGDNITRMSLNSFLPESHSNQIVDCQEIPGIDLRKF